MDDGYIPLIKRRISEDKSAPRFEVITPLGRNGKPLFCAAHHVGEPLILLDDRKHWIYWNYRKDIDGIYGCFGDPIHSRRYPESHHLT